MWTLYAKEINLILRYIQMRSTTQAAIYLLRFKIGKSAPEIFSKKPSKSYERHRTILV